MVKVTMDWICGVRATRARLVVDPCIPADRPGLRAYRRCRGADYEIEIGNPNGVCRGVESLNLEGEPLIASPIPPAKDGRRHIVRVTVGG